MCVYYVLQCEKCSTMILITSNRKIIFANNKIRYWQNKYDYLDELINELINVFKCFYYRYCAFYHEYNSNLLIFYYLLFKYLAESLNYHYKGNQRNYKHTYCPNYPTTSEERLLCSRRACYHCIGESSAARSLHLLIRYCCVRRIISWLDIRIKMI